MHQTSPPCTVIMTLMQLSAGTKTSFRERARGWQGGGSFSLVFPELSEGQRDRIHMLLPPQRPLMKANTGFLQLRAGEDVATCKAARRTGRGYSSGTSAAISLHSYPSPHQSQPLSHKTRGLSWGHLPSFGRGSEEGTRAHCHLSPSSQVTQAVEEGEDTP